MFQRLTIICLLLGLLQSHSIYSANIAFNKLDTVENIVSLKDDPSIRALTWVEDFTYQHIDTIAQRKNVVAYTMKMHEDYVENLKKRELPWVFPTHSSDEDFVVAYSSGWLGDPKIEPLPIFGYQITNPHVNRNKLKIVLVGGNHGREDPACWTFHGLIDFLVSDDPRAVQIRDHVTFYVYPAVNPDGRQYILSKKHASLMTVNGSPEIKSAGETNHNRLWNTAGSFISIDKVKAAIRKDVEGSADYLFDFHGIPLLTFLFADEEAARSPLGEALLRGGFNLRNSVVPDTVGSKLRDWAVSKEGVAKYAFTPEVASLSKEEHFLEGQQFALAFHDMITETKRPIPHLEKKEVTPVQPKQPISSWLFDGNAINVAKDSRTPVSENLVKWSEESHFSYEGNQSLILGNEHSSIDFGGELDLDSRQSITVSLWIKGHSDETSDPRSIIGRFLAPDQGSWSIVQMGRGLTDIMVSISGDGTRYGNNVKRNLSNIWPAKYIFDGTWRHFAFTYKSGGEGELKLYVDGQELRAGSGLHSYDEGKVKELFQAEANLRLGATEDNNAFQGQLDEIGIWDYALSAHEIEWLVNNSLKNINRRKF